MSSSTTSIASTKYTKRRLLQSRLEDERHHIYIYDDNRKKYNKPFGVAMATISSFILSAIRRHLQFSVCSPDFSRERSSNRRENYVIILYCMYNFASNTTFVLPDTSKFTHHCQYNREACNVAIFKNINHQTGRKKVLDLEQCFKIYERYLLYRLKSFLSV